MSAWDTYRDRIEVHGATVREAAYKQEVRMLTNKLRENLSYFTVTIFDQDHGYNITSEEMQAGAISQNVAIINSDNLNEKYIYTQPGEDIEHGSLVQWMDNYWLVTERDANTNVYTRAKMIQCNYLLKWVTEDKQIVEQWCIVEDGTKLRRIRYAQWFGVLETICKKNPFNCWNTLRAIFTTARS